MIHGKLYVVNPAVCVPPRGSTIRRPVTPGSRSSMWLRKGLKIPYFEVCTGVIFYERGERFDDLHVCLRRIVLDELFRERSERGAIELT